MQAETDAQTVSGRPDASRNAAGATATPPTKNGLDKLDHRLLHTAGDDYPAYQLVPNDAWRSQFPSRP